MKKIAVLGSTGNLGKKTVKLLSEKYKNYFEVVAITGHQNFTLLKKQGEVLGLKSNQAVQTKKNGLEKIRKILEDNSLEIVINLISGISGLPPSLKALKKGKKLLLANKESIVAAGEKLNALSGENQIMPLDSEHNAIYEIKKNNPEKKIKKIYLTCSGGPFFRKKTSELNEVTVEQALKHPSWEMGAKISIESATLINKALEIIEAHYLFKIPLEKIEVIIHPECEIHSAVEFEGGETSAYLAPPDMSRHLENALLRSLGKNPLEEKTYHLKPLDQTKFSFQPPDHKTFPSIKIITKLFQKSPRKMQTFLEIEEKIINDFLEKKITFLEIFEKLENAAKKI